eukprot:5050383-Amphidinium_carterae.2
MVIYMTESSTIGMMQKMNIKLPSPTHFLWKASSILCQVDRDVSGFCPVLDTKFMKRQENMTSSTVHQCICLS